jgi:hypothetical protein
MRIFLGILLLVIGVAGVCGSVYVGLWLMLFGGIIDFINACKADEVIPKDVAWAIFKIITAKIVLVLMLIASCISAVVGGTILVEKSKEQHEST